jgi:hypothetical protein
MTYLLDTNIVSFFNKRSIPEKLKDWLRVNASASFLSAVTIAEMRFGLPGVDAPDHAIIAERIAQTEIRFVHAVEPLDVSVLTRWKHLLSGLRSKNRTMTCEDSLIAATALANDHMLVTDNTRHFQPAEEFGLQILNPLD